MHLMRIVWVGALSCGLTGLTAMAGVTTCAWNFNGPKGTTDPSTGSGSAVLAGGCSANFSAGSPTDTDAPTAAENKGWNLAGFAAQGTGSGERGATFLVATTGFTGITVSWQERHSNSASRFVQFQYSLDGTSFTSDGLANQGIFEATMGGDAWQGVRTVDLSPIAGAADNPKFAFRVVSIFAPDSSAYSPTNPTSNYSATGTMRFDLVSVSGSTVPAPAALALGGMGAVIAASGRRRE